jgi:hypothetical protein
MRADGKNYGDDADVKDWKNYVDDADKPVVAEMRK